MNVNRIWRQSAKFVMNIQYLTLKPIIFLSVDTKIIQGRTLCPWAKVLGYGVLPDDFLFRKNKKSRYCGSYLVSYSITYAYNTYQNILVSLYIKKLLKLSLPCLLLVGQKTLSLVLSGMITLYFVFDLLTSIKRLIFWSSDGPRHHIRDKLDHHIYLTAELTNRGGAGGYFYPLLISPKYLLQSYTPCKTGGTAQLSEPETPCGASGTGGTSGSC